MDNSKYYVMFCIQVYNNYYIHSDIGTYNYGIKLFFNQLNNRLNNNIAVRVISKIICTPLHWSKHLNN